VSLLDLLLMVIIGGSVVFGFLAGFARAGVGFLAAVTGVLFGFWFYGIPAEWIRKYVSSSTFSNLAGFLVVFFACAQPRFGARLPGGGDGRGGGGGHASSRTPAMSRPRA